MRVWYLPLEPLPERYTEQMRQWVIDGLVEAGHSVMVIEPAKAEIEESASGQFLNWRQRVRYATSQIAELARRWSEVKEGDRILIADIWHPGLSGVRYLAHATNKRVGVFAISYAVFCLKKKNMAPALSWAGLQEQAWTAQCDGVFVGSDYHRSLLPSAMQAKTWVTGLVWGEDAEVRQLAGQGTFDEAGKRTVVWPHRIAPEKRPEWFAEIARRLGPKFPDVRWIVSSGRASEEWSDTEVVCHNKAGYYRLLQGASLMVSTARQETWGYTLREAAALGVPVLTTDEACYPEFVPVACRTSDLDVMTVRIERHLTGELPIPPLRLGDDDGLALTRMADIMEDWQ